MDREPEFQERNWTRIREGQERAQRTLDPRLDRALLALGDALRGARCPPTERIAALDKLVGLTPGMAQGRRRQGDRRLPRHAATRGRRWPTRTSGSACSTRPRPRSRRRRTRSSTSRSRSTRCTRRTARREAPPGRALAPAPALHAGAAREGGRPRRARRERHAARDLRHGQGQARRRTGSHWTRVHDARRASSRSTPARASSTRPTRELDAIKALRAGKTDAVRRRRRSATCRSTSSRPSTRPAATPARRRSTARASSCGLLFDGTYDTVASDFLYDPVQHALDPRRRALHALGHDARSTAPRT